MGLFKKIFKPVSKVLDKVIPNEIKPALPYIAAFAPFMMPPGFGTGFASGLFKTQAAQQMAARALLGGGANVLIDQSSYEIKGPIDSKVRLEYLFCTGEMFLPNYEKK